VGNAASGAACFGQTLGASGLCAKRWVAGLRPSEVTLVLNNDGWSNQVPFPVSYRRCISLSGLEVSSAQLLDLLEEDLRAIRARKIRHRIGSVTFSGNFPDIGDWYPILGGVSTGILSVEGTAESSKLTYRLTFTQSAFFALFFFVLITIAKPGKGFSISESLLDLLTILFLFGLFYLMTIFRFQAFIRRSIAQIKSRKNSSPS
jgi:hypothetical protein